MNPEPPPSPQADPRSPPKRRRPALFRVGWVMFGVLLVAVTGVIVFSIFSEEKVVWMTQDELARSFRPGPFTPFKQKLKQLTAPLWQRLRRKRSLVLIRSKVLAMPSAFSETFQLDSPVTIGKNGLQAWTLSSAQFETLTGQIKKLPPERIVSAPQVSNFAGGWASISAVTTVPIQRKGKLAGVQITVNAKSVRTSWKVTCSITATTPIISGGTNFLGLRTNLATACRAMVPNAGALVIEGANPATTTGTNYWVILSPVAIDARGKPITY